MHDLPARALRQVPPDINDHQREYRADDEGEPPALVGREVVQQVQRDQGADDGATQYVAFTDRSTRPRYLAGTISSIAELMAAYFAADAMPAITLVA